MTRTKVLMAALTAALLLSLGAGTAAALRSLSVVGETTVTLNSRRLTFENGSSIICEVTMIKTISRVIPKRFPILIGGVRDIRTASCTSPLGTPAPPRFLNLNTATDWRIIADGFQGRLPGIEGLRARIEKSHTLFEIRTFLGTVNCLYSGEIDGLVHISPTTGKVEFLETIRVDNLILDNANGLNSGSCGATGHFTATGTEGRLNDLTAYTVKLV